MTEPTDVVRAFIDEVNGRDVDAIMGYFTEDAVYHNMPMPPAQGTDAIRNVIQMFVAPADAIDWEITYLASTGPHVLTERIDRFTMGGKNIALPVMGTFDIANGKITAWRDYFDMADWQRQLEA